MEPHDQYNLLSILSILLGMGLLKWSEAKAKIPQITSTYLWTTYFQFLHVAAVSVIAFCRLHSCLFRPVIIHYIDIRLDIVQLYIVIMYIAYSFSC